MYYTHKTQIEEKVPLSFPFVIVSLFKRKINS